MKSFKITFKSMEEILKFVNTVEKYDCAMDMRRGRFTVDAKSLLGVMNLGLNREIELKIYEENCEQLEQDISCYLAA